MRLFHNILEKGVLFLKVREGARLFLFFCKAAGKKHVALKIKSFPMYF